MFMVKNVYLKIQKLLNYMDWYVYGNLSAIFPIRLTLYKKNHKLYMFQWTRLY